MIKKRFVLIATFLLLTACANDNDANNAFKPFIGQSADSFFTTYGLPKEQYAMTDGARLYQWSGASDRYSFCRLKITADVYNRITMITINNEGRSLNGDTDCGHYFRFNSPSTTPR